MNKKVAVILCTAALLGAGIPIGIKVKNKKEKEEIEKTLKTVLIPNAEKELNNLMHESRLLRDSIAYFQIVLDSFEKRTNIRKYFPQLQEISTLTRSVLCDWHKQYDILQSQVAQYANEDSVPVALQAKLYPFEKEITYGKRLDFALESSIETISNAMRYFSQPDDKLTASNTTTQISNIQSSLNTISQSLKISGESEIIINTTNTQKLQNRIKQTMPIIDSISNTLHPADKIKQQELKFKQLQATRYDVGEKIKEQMITIAKLKHSNAVEQIQKEKKRSK